MFVLMYLISRLEQRQRQGQSEDEGHCHLNFSQRNITDVKAEQTHFTLVKYFCFFLTGTNEEMFGKLFIVFFFFSFVFFGICSHLFFRLAVDFLWTVILILDSSDQTQFFEHGAAENDANGGLRI